MEIRGKKYRWKLQDMHPFILVSGFIVGLLVAAASFYAMVFVIIALSK